MPRKLLLADDSVTIQKAVAIVFAHEDFEIIPVGNGDDAIARAREVRPDIVLADVVMPGKDGYEVCAALKSDPATRDIPVLLLAGAFEPFDEARARTVGCDGHMPKPFETARLLERVKQLVESPRSGGALARPAAPASHGAAGRPPPSVILPPQRPGVTAAAAPSASAAAAGARAAGASRDEEILLDVEDLDFSDAAIEDDGLAPVGAAAKPPSFGAVDTAGPRLGRTGVGETASPFAGQRPGASTGRSAPAAGSSTTAGSSFGGASSLGAGASLGTRPGAVASPGAGSAPGGGASFGLGSSSGAAASLGARSTPGAGSSPGGATSFGTARAGAGSTAGTVDTAGPRLGRPAEAARSAGEGLGASPAPRDATAGTSFDTLEPIGAGGARAPRPAPDRGAAGSLSLGSTAAGARPSASFGAASAGIRTAAPPRGGDALSSVGRPPPPAPQAGAADRMSAGSTASARDPNAAAPGVRPAAPSWGDLPTAGPARALGDLPTAGPANVVRPTFGDAAPAAASRNGPMNETVASKPADDGGEAALRAALSAASREVIERIAWEVVPQLAEVIVREHVERLARQKEGR